MPSSHHRRQFDVGYIWRKCLTLGPFPTHVWMGRQKTHIPNTRQHLDNCKPLTFHSIYMGVGCNTNAFTYKYIHVCAGCRDLYVVQASIGFGVRCGNVVYVADVWVYRILKNISNLVSRIVVVPVAFVVIGFCCSCKRKRKLQPPQAEAENACLMFVHSFTFTFRHKMKNQSFDQKWIWLTDWLAGWLTVVAVRNRLRSLAASQWNNYVKVNLTSITEPQ